MILHYPIILHENRGYFQEFEHGKMTKSEVNSDFCH